MKDLATNNLQNQKNAAGIINVGAFSSAASQADDDFFRGSRAAYRQFSAQNM
jgi:hypothetical protein